MRGRWLVLTKPTTGCFHIRDRVDLSIDFSLERPHSDLCLVIGYSHKIFVFSSVSSGKCPDITWIRPLPLRWKSSVNVLFNAMAKINCRWSPILLPKLVPDYITGIQDTCLPSEERNPVRKNYSARLGAPLTHKACPRLDSPDAPIIISKVTSTSRNRNLEYCFLSGERSKSEIPHNKF
jgi:hypothetical protein